MRFLNSMIEVRWTWPSNHRWNHTLTTSCVSLAAGRVAVGASPARRSHADRGQRYKRDYQGVTRKPWVTLFASTYHPVISPVELMP